MVLTSSKKITQLPLAFEGRSALGREDFLIGRSNQEAVNWIDRWPDWPAPLLVISGPAASGKTHLAEVWREKTGAEMIKPEMLISKGADAISAVSETIVVDGVDPWLGFRESEECLFHLYNIFKDERRTFLITMRMPPSHAEFVIADLASRVRAAPLADIHPPDDMLLGSVLIKLFSDRQLTVGHDVIRYILPRMERSFAAARDIVGLADKMALSQKRRISVPLMRDVMAHMQDH